MTRVPSKYLFKKLFKENYNLFYKSTEQKYDCRGFWTRASRKLDKKVKNYYFTKQK